MQIVKSRAGRARAACAAAVLAAGPSLSLAGIGFSGGSATWSWDADTATTNGGKTTFAITPPSSGSMPVSPSFQLDRSGSFGSASATGKGSLGYVTNSTTATFTLARGTGVAQADPSDELPGNTVTKVQFSGLFSPTSPSFGPTATGYFSLAVAGTAGIGGYTQIAFDMQFRLNSAAGALLRSGISGGTTFFGTGEPTPFSQVWTYSSALSPSTISPADKIFVSGSMTFIASNLGSPSDVAPIGLDAGAAPPTATFYGDGGFGFNWSAPATWTPPNNPASNVFSFTEPGALIPAVPNGVGQRARFFGNAPEGRGAALSEPITLGAVHIDSRSTIGIGGVGANNLTMDVIPADNATIYVGNSYGDGSHEMNVDVVLADNLEIRVEAVDPGEPDGGSLLSFNDPISHAGGTPRDVTISGGGRVEFNSANTYDGTTTITDGGQLNVNADGGLGAGPVVVNNGGILVIGAASPTAAGQAINIGPGGGVQFRAGGFGSLLFSVAPGAVISGDGTFLSALSVGTPPGGNLQLSPGAIVGHTEFEPNPLVGNPQNLGSTPNYVFGIANSFFDLGIGSITVGTGSGSPWIGFGNDGQDRVYGDTPGDPGSAAVNVAGNADLVSPGGRLILNAPVIGGTSTSMLDVRGGGAVELNSPSNSFAGQVRVNGGATLRVNGALTSSAGVQVHANGRLSGGGTITSAVNVADGGIVDPGAETGVASLVGTITTGSMTLGPESLLDFDFGGNDDGVSDRVHVNGDLVLDGLLRINQLELFDEGDAFTILMFTGSLTNNGLTVDPSSQDILGLPAGSAVSIEVQFNRAGVSGGSVVLVVPEPGSLGMLAGSAIFAGRRFRKSR